MAYYVQRQDRAEIVPLETVDEASTRQIAAQLAITYREGDPSAIYYVSSVPCKGWVNK